MLAHNLCNILQGKCVFHFTDEEHETQRDVIDSMKVTQVLKRRDRVDDLIPKPVISLFLSLHLPPSIPPSPSLLLSPSLSLSHHFIFLSGTLHTDHPGMQQTNVGRLFPESDLHLPQTKDFPNKYAL